MKTCACCTEYKSISEFGVDRHRKDGRDPYCKVCKNSKGRQYREKNKDVLSIRQKEARKNKPHSFLGYEAKYRAANRGKRRSASRKYTKENSESIRLRSAVSRAKRKDKIKEYNTSYYRRNVPAYRARELKRSSVEKLATPAWLSAIQVAQIEEFYEIAAARTVQEGGRFHVDHIFPLTGKGFNGLHVPWNLQILTETENSSKNNRLQAEHIHMTWGTN